MAKFKIITFAVAQFFEDEVNDFLKDKKLIDSKVVQSDGTIMLFIFYEG